MSSSNEALDSKQNPLFEAWRTQTARISPAGGEFAFDCDQTLIQGDIGEATYRLALSRRAIISHDAWWLHLEEGEVGSASERAAWRAAYERDLCADMADSMMSSPLSELDPLSAELWEAYRQLCSVNVHSGYVYAARLVYQRSRPEVEALTTEAFRRDPTVSARPLMREFISMIHERSGGVWVVSSSQAEIVSVIARLYHIPAERVIGIDFKRDIEGRYTDQLCEPAPINTKKVDALREQIQVISDGTSEAFEALELMAGDSRYDLPMMEWAQVGILIDHGRSAELTQAARSMSHVIIDAGSLDR